MLHLHARIGEQDPDHVKLILLAGASVPIYPDARGLGEFALLAMMHGLEGIAEVFGLPHLHFYEGDERIALRDEIDVTPPEPKPPREDCVSLLAQPSLGDAFAKRTETLIVRHARKVGRRARDCRIGSLQA